MVGTYQIRLRTSFAIVLCPSHSFPNLMALVAASAFTPKASKVARTANRSRNMAILWLAKRHKNITAAPDLAMMCADFAVFTTITNCTGLPCEESFVLRLGFYFCGAQRKAERGGFEPPARVLPMQLLSRQPCSATPAPLRVDRSRARLEAQPFYYRRRSLNSEAGMSGTRALSSFTRVRHAFASEG